MFLYDKRSNVIDIYDLKSDPEEIENYRKEKMQLLPADKQIFRAKQVCYRNRKEPLFEEMEDSLDSNFNSHVIADRKIPSDTSYHLILPEFNLLGKELLLDNYYKGKYIDRKTAVILYQNFKYFLLTERKYDKCKNDDYTYQMRNIIQIPQILYALQLLEQEKYDLFLKQDVNHKELLSLFQKVKLGEISEEELLNIDRYGITDKAYDRVIEKVNNDKKLVKRIIVQNP